MITSLNTEQNALLPEPGMLRLGPPPYWHRMPGIVPITVVFTLAAFAVAVSGTALFGWYSIRVLAISAAVALLVESAFNAIKGRSPSWSESNALLIGLLFGCTLPATVSWRVPATGAFIAIVVGEALAGGIGNYIWHPVAIGRVAVQLFFDDEMNAATLPVLAPGQLLWGTLDRATKLPELCTWSTQPQPTGIEAWLVRPVEILLLEPLPRISNEPASGLVGFVRDATPPWWDTLTGVAGGAIGEACVAALVIVAGLLLWRGFLRWPMVLAAVVSAMVMAAVLPVQTHAAEGSIVACTLPGLTMWDGLPVGAAYVLYHLTAGGFLFVVLLLAPDPSSSPLTSRGHMAFGILIGAMTIFLRVSLSIPAAAYWALLAANTLVPTINRMTRRRVLGT